MSVHFLRITHVGGRRGMGVCMVLPWLIVFFLYAPPCSSPARAYDAFQYDRRLVGALARIGMYDYAMRQIELLKRAYPARQEDIMVEEARVLLSMGNIPKAQALLARIPATSPGFARSRLLLANAAFQKGDLAAAAKAFGEFFAVHHNPLGKSRSAMEEFRRAVEKYAAVLRRLGKGEEAARILDYLGSVRGAGLSSRQLAFLKAQAVLSAEDRKAREGKKIDTAAVAKARDQLEGLQWRAVDAVAAAGLVEAAHADVLVGKFDQAVATLDGAKEILAKVEEVLKREKKSNASPVAGAHFYYGKALEGKAVAEMGGKKADKSAAKKDLSRALAHFYRVVKEYPDSPYATPALAEFGACRKLLEEKFGVHVAVKGGLNSEVHLKQKQADAFYESRKFQDALPLYLQIVQAAWGTREFPGAAARSVGCYARLGRFLEAEALADALADAWPRNPATADALLRLGALLYRAGKREKNPAKQRDALEGATRIWGRFVRLAPTHPKAAEIAFFVAEQAYKLAYQKAEAAKHLRSKKAKAAATKEARALYEAAIPLYRRVTDLFGGTPQGIRAWYKLGWIYYSLDRKAEAAGAFERYAQSEESPHRIADRLEAKFRTAECLMFSGRPEAAVPHLEELLAWTAAGNRIGVDPKSPAAGKKREQAANYLGWAWDLAAEEYRPKIEKIQQKIRRLADQAADWRAERDRLAAQLKTLDAQRTAAQKAFEEMTRDLTGAGEQVAALAEAEAKARGEHLEGLSAEERTVAMRSAKALAERMRRQLEQHEKERIVGEKIQLENERESLKTERKAIQAALKRMAETGKNGGGRSRRSRKKKHKKTPKAAGAGHGFSRELKAELSRRQKRLEYVTARLAAVALALRKNEQERKLAAADSARRATLEADLNALRGKVLDAYRRAWEKQREYLDFVIAEQKRALAAVTRKIRTAEKRIAAAKKSLAPLEHEFEKRKRLARDKFEEFLKTWPRSKFAPETMARLGAVYVELDDYRKAAKIFNELARRYPDSDAVGKAFFDLGRAESELGHWDKAEEAFGKLLQHAGKPPLAALVYISDRMLKAGRPRTSLAAAREILRRTAAGSGSAAPEAYVRENAWFRAGEACFLMKKYGEALRYYTKLLKESPKTAYYYTVKLHSGIARREMRPPDYQAALADFGEIVLYAKDPALVNQALCETGATYEKMPGDANRRLALARYQQVALLANPDVAANRPWIEQALYRSAVLFAQTGDAAGAEKAVERYHELFPKGKYAAALNALKLPRKGKSAPGAASRE